MRMENGLTFKKRIMKKLLLLALVGMSFMSCEKEPIKVVNQYRVEIRVSKPNKQYQYSIQEDGWFRVPPKGSIDTLSTYEWSREGEKSLRVDYDGQGGGVIGEIKLFKNGSLVASKKTPEGFWYVWLEGLY